MSNINSFPAKSKTQRNILKKLLEKAILQDIPNTTLNELDKSFKKNYGTTFTKEIKKNYSLNAINKKKYCK